MESFDTTDPQQVKELEFDFDFCVHRSLYKMIRNLKNLAAGPGRAANLKRITKWYRVQLLKRDVKLGKPKVQLPTKNPASEARSRQSVALLARGRGPLAGAAEHEPALALAHSRSLDNL